MRHWIINTFICILVAFQLNAQNKKAFAVERITSPLKQITKDFALLNDNSTINLKAKSKQFVLIMIRHAEKLSREEDAGITEKGALRTSDLATMMEGYPVNAVYVTEFQRSQQTGKILSDALGCPLVAYGARDFEKLIESIIDQGHQRVIIVGHANTIPDLTNFIASTSLKSYTETDYSRMVIIKTDFKKGKVFSLKY